MPAPLHPDNDKALAFTPSNQASGRSADHKYPEAVRASAIIPLRVAVAHENREGWLKPSCHRT